MTCKICNNTKGQSFEVKELMFGLKDTFEYFLCSDCGCLQIINIPEDISKYYPDTYYSFTMDSDSYDYLGIAGKMRRIRDEYAIFNKGLLGRMIFNFKPNTTLRWLTFCNITRQSRILDIGCGSGKLLHILRELGFSALLGIDPYISAPIKYKNGLVIDKKEILQQEGQWDLIMLHHSLEHIEKQEETMRAIHDLLSPNGIGLIRIPIVPSFAWNRYREKWVQWDAPRHFFIHSVKSIKQLGRRANLKLIKVVHDSNELQFIGSEQYEKGITLRGRESFFSNPATSIFTAKQIKEFRSKAKELNKQEQGDQAVFYFKKIK